MQPLILFSGGYHLTAVLIRVPGLFSNRGMAENRRFPPPRTVETPHPDSFAVKDANGIILATVHCRDDLQKWSFGHSKLTSDEARKIAKAISLIPEFMMQRRGFYRGPGNYRWKVARPFHVALEDSYIRANYDTISELCKLNGIPFNATGEKIRGEGLWCVYEFGQQLDAMMFWDRFKGRWLHGEEFCFPDRPENMPAMKEPKRRDSFVTKPPDLRR
jgi:hypothetical protein